MGNEQRSRNDVLKHFLEWHADHFDDFSSEINAQLLCLANEAQEALSVASEKQPFPKALRGEWTPGRCLHLTGVIEIDALCKYLNEAQK